MDDNITSFEGDFFCEQLFWHQHHINTPVTHPLAALTGVFLVIMPFFPNVLIGKDEVRAYNFHSFIPRQFQLCKSTLALTGIGTMIFHSISADQSREWHINYHMCDWMPITLMGNSIIVLYVSNLFQMSERKWTLLFLVIGCWSSFLGLAMDSSTEAYYSNEWNNWGQQKVYGTLLNLTLLLPLSLTLAFACWRRIRARDQIPLWIAITIVLMLWLSNAYLCERYPVTSVFHALYHAVISYVFIYAACLGVSLDSEWRFRYNQVYWPTLQHIGQNEKKDAWLVGVTIEPVHVGGGP
jgi:hypothetical protein